MIFVTCPRHLCIKTPIASDLRHHHRSSHGGAIWNKQRPSKGLVHDLRRSKQEPIKGLHKNLSTGGSLIAVVHDELT